MGRVPMNAMKKEDVEKLGGKGHDPIPDPTVKKEGPKKSNSDRGPAIEKSGSGWF